MKKNVIEPTTAKGVGTEIQESDITMKEKVYTFRTLNATDIFPMFNLISKIGLNEISKSFNADEVKKLIKGAENNTVVGISVGMDMINVLLGNLSKCETEIYHILSSTSNLSLEEVKGLDFATFTEMVIDFVKKEEFKDFIKVVSRLFKPMN